MGAKLSSSPVKIFQCFYLIFFASVTVASRYYLQDVHDSDEGSADYNRILAAEFVIPQNLARIKVGEPPLVWDEEVANYARLWAEERRRDCNLTHSNGPYGENIFWGSGDGWRPREAVAAWLGERRWYNHKINSCRGYELCGHYTQIVWKQTRRVGCARVVCDNDDIFMICNYDPPGNYIGEKPY